MADSNEHNIQSAEFENLVEDKNKQSNETDMEMVLDIPVTLSVEVGKTQISIRHLLQLNQGSVVELDRLAGEPLDIKVNGTLIAHGEVVVVNDTFAIRIIDVISRTERVQNLK